MNIGEEVTLDQAQAALVLGHPLKKISKGTRAPWAGNEVEIVGVGRDCVQIRRVAYSQVPFTENPTSGTSEHLYPEEFFQIAPSEHMRSDPKSLTKHRTGPVEVRILQPGEDPAGETTDPLITAPSTPSVGVEPKKKYQVKRPPGYFQNTPKDDIAANPEHHASRMEVLRGIIANWMSKAD
jgi:hypothetical protein